MSYETENVAAFGTRVPEEMAAPRRSGRIRALAADGIWSRIGLLFGILCVLKLVILAGFAKHLFEIHWRVSAQPFNWVNPVAFYTFAGLAGLTLWSFGTRTARLGISAARSANLCVLVLSASFIFLTFHEGDKNYLAPVMSGILQPSDLGSYLSLNFFFRPPYLAVWVFVYALGYYFLVRTHREPFVLKMTALFAAAYLVLCLRDLMQYHDALVVLDAIGLAVVIAARRSIRPLHWAGVCLLFFGVAFLVWLFGPFDSEVSLRGMNPEFEVILAGSIILFAGVTILIWRRGAFVAWSWILPFAFCAFLLLINCNYPTSANYNNFLCVGLLFPRYFLGEFLIVAALAVCALAYRRWRPGGSLLWLDVLNLIIIAIALVDLRLSQLMGTRLDWQVLSLAFGETPKMMWRMARPYLPLAGLALFVIVAIYCALIWSARKLGRDSGARLFPRLQGSIGFCLVGFIVLAVAGNGIVEGDKAVGESAILLAETSPLWHIASDPPMDRSAFAARARDLGMTQPASLAPASTPKPAADLNVVLIFQESSYNKYLSLFDGKEDTQPLLSKYKDRMELFPNFFSSFAGSINARFATFTGLYPVRDYKAFTLNHVPVKSLFEILHDHGYKNSLFYSSYFDYTGFRDFLRGRDIDELYDADTMPGERKTPPVSWGLREEETLGAIQSKIKDYAARKQKFFLTYVPAAPHNPFDGTPPRFLKFRREKFGDFTPAYLNELLYMDWVISSIVDQVKESGLLDKTLIVITDDHGEMLGQNGGPVGHGWALNPGLANIPLIIMDPRDPGYHVNTTVGSQVDLLPTLLSQLGIPVPDDQLYQGVSLYSPEAADDRTIYLNTFRQYGIIEGNRLVCAERGDLVDGHPPDEKAFEITNDGARTLFPPTTPPDNLPSINDFDTFQANFLRNYARYCDLLRTQAVAAK